MKEFEYFIIEICRKKWKNLNNIGRGGGGDVDNFINNEGYLDQYYRLKLLYLLEIYKDVSNSFVDIMYFKVLS